MPKRKREKLFEDDEEDVDVEALKDRVEALEENLQSDDDDEDEADEEAAEKTMPVSNPEDGITNMLEDEEVLELLARKESVEKTEILIELPASKETKEKERIKLNPESIQDIKKRMQTILFLLSNWKVVVKQMKAKSDDRFKSRQDLIQDFALCLTNVYGYSKELAMYILELFSPNEALDFVEANEKPQMTTIRTNTLKTRRKALAQALIGRGVNLDPIGEWTKVGLKVYNSGVPLGATPEYLGGHYMIQSASSFVPVMALDPQPGETILDMAASPGGKSTHIGQLLNNQGILFCNEMKKERLPALTANLHRMGITNSIVMSYDGRKLRKVLPPLDRVLLDAPCSGLGVISRDPSVKTKRGVEDFRENGSLQKELLSTAIDMTKVGGTIVYSTCSLSVEENEVVIDHTLKNRHVRIEPIDFNIGSPALPRFKEYRFHQSVKNARRIYPHVHQMDGFFVCKMTKLSERVGQKRDRRKGLKTVEWDFATADSKMMEEFCDFQEE